MKMAGALLVVGATSWGGMTAASKVRNQYAQVQSLQRLINRLRGEILYARSYLGEAFRQIGASGEEPYKGWMYAMWEQMQRRDGKMLADIWEKQTREHLADSGLPEQALVRLIRLGRQLGAADIEMQVKVLDLYLEDLNLIAEDIREGMKAKIRLYHCLGVMSGIFVTVLLI